MTALRILGLAVALSALTGCGGGSSGIFGNNGFTTCNPGTQAQLEHPSPGQSGVGAITSIEIVASGNQNAVGQNYSAWQVQVQNQFGVTTLGGNLVPVSDTGSPHPYQSDYFYSSSFPALQTGVTYTASLVQNGACQPFIIGSFST